MIPSYVILFTILRAFRAGRHEGATNLKIVVFPSTSDTGFKTIAPRAVTWKSMCAIRLTLLTMSGLLKRTVLRISPWTNLLHLPTCGVVAHSSGSTSCRRCAADLLTFVATKSITSLPTRPFKSDRSTRKQGSGLGIKSSKTRPFAMTF